MLFFYLGADPSIGIAMREESSVWFSRNSNAVKPHTSNKSGPGCSERDHIDSMPLLRRRKSCIPDIPIRPPRSRMIAPWRENTPQPAWSCLQSRPASWSRLWQLVEPLDCNPNMFCGAAILPSANVAVLHNPAFPAGDVLRCIPST